MTFKYLIRFCCSALVISISCDSYDEKNGVPEEGYYVFGTQNASAVYWKNGKMIDVDGNTAYFAGAAVSGADVYAIGYVDDDKTYHGAAYWKNGKMVKLSKSSMNQVPTAIAFHGTDMYIAGFEDIADKSFAIYWKNGESHVLSDKEGYARPTAIAVSGSDVHIIGWAQNRMFDPDTVLAMYWKNGERIKVTPTGSFEMLEDIALSGNDVYFTGYTMNNDGLPRAKIWKNGTATTLTTGTVRSYATEIEVHETDVYVGGRNGPHAVYWKNSVMTPLETGAMSGSEMSGMVVVRDQLVISGKNLNDVSGSPGFQGSFVWRDGQLQPPFNGTNVNFVIHCIAPAE